MDTVDEKRADSYLAKIKAIKRVGKIIIDFLSQIEDFQKKLWLKKKFVVSTDWCITLDQIDESYYSEIIKNKGQVQEWIDMYGINEIEGDQTTVAYAEPLTLEFLRQNRSLVVDTRYFSTDFKDKLISSIDNLDFKSNGLLLHSENFQALRLLQERYKEQVQCIYIDPPYNTDASKILYKNNYEHSSWLSLMSDRLIEGRKFLKRDGIQATAIDEYELRELYSLILDIFTRENNAGIVAIRSNPSGRPRDGGLALSHEYAIVSKNSSEARIVKIDRSEKQASRYDKSDKKGAYEQRNFRREGSNSDRSDGVRQWYPIFVDKESLTIRVSEMDWDTENETWIIYDPATENEVIVWPINDDGIEKNWRWAWENVQKDYSEFYAILQKSGMQVYYKFRPNDEGISPLTFWDNTKYSAVEHGTKLLKKIHPRTKFSYPKSLYAVEDMIAIIGGYSNDFTIIDYFAGSGTTAHAIIRLNKADDGNRKYLLIEMGEYFESDTLPRVKKAIYSPDAQNWKAGKPLAHQSGVSQIIKYLQIESYEDALSNIKLSEEKHQISTLFGDEYLINYMFDVEAKDSMLNLDSFKMPFSYKMKINENNETKEKTIDLCETFNYLIGLNVVRQSALTYFNAKPDKDGSYEGAVRLFQDMDGQFAFKQIEGTLPDGRRALIIWRIITDDLIQSNAALDSYFNKHRVNPLDREFDVVFVNGDNNLGNGKTDDDNWKVNIIESAFKRHMFEEV